MRIDCSRRGWNTVLLNFNVKGILIIRLWKKCSFKFYRSTQHDTCIPFYTDCGVFHKAPWNTTVLEIKNSSSIQPRKCVIKILQKHCVYVCVTFTSRLSVHETIKFNAKPSAWNLHYITISRVRRNVLYSRVG